MVRKRLEVTDLFTGSTLRNGTFDRYFRDAGIEKEVSAFTIGIPDAESIRCPRIPIGTNAGKLGRCLKRGIEIGLSSFSGAGEITCYGERGKCKTPG